jgi:hypothetical protein
MFLVVAARQRRAPMIDIVLQLVDRLTQLVKIREERKDKQFRELAQRLFTDLETVHKDYLIFLESARSSLMQREDIRDVLARFEKDRLQQEPLRRRLWQLLEAARDQEKFKPLERFLHANARYFAAASPARDQHEWFTISRIIEKVLRGLEEGQRQSAINGIDAYLMVIRHDWDVVAREYARLLTESL